MLFLALLIGCVLAPAKPPPPSAAAPPNAAAPPHAPAPPSAAETAGRFAVLEPGLELAELEGIPHSTLGDSRITVLRVDPERFDLVLVQAATEDGTWRTARGWAEREGLVATINPGMYHFDGSLVFYGKADGTVRNGTLSSKAGALVVAGPVTGELPRARVVDTHCDGGSAVLSSYRTAVQSYRLLDCDGAPAWKPSSRRWSHAVVGEDAHGRILFIVARSPWSTHDFAQVLRALPLHLVRASYGEGGPEVSLYVHAGSVQREWFGSYETGFHEDDGNDYAWPLPNVLGMRRRTPGSGR